jgi:hypothetical protein
MCMVLCIHTYYIINDKIYLTIHTAYVSTLICPLKRTSIEVKFWWIMPIGYHTKQHYKNRSHWFHCSYSTDCYYNMINKISLIVNICLTFMHRTVWQHLLFIQPRYVCTLKMGYCSKSCGWMEIRFNIGSYITVYITHKLGCWNILWENLQFISQSVFLHTLLEIRTV